MSMPRLTAAVALAALATTLPAAATTSYHLVDLGNQSRGMYINHEGAVAGSKLSRAALYTHGTWRKKQPDLYSIANAIDEKPHGGRIGSALCGSRRHLERR